MNIVKTTVAHLSGALGVPVSSDVPRERPDAFVTVERGGGEATEVDDRASLTLQVWDRDRLALEDLAKAAADAMLAMPQAVDEVFSVSVSQSYYPEQINQQWPRYVLSCEVYCAW